MAIRNRTVLVLICCLVVGAIGASGLTASGAGAGETVRGFDGTTVTVGGLGGLANLAGADIGAKGRFERFNSTNELKGVKIEYVGFADDKLDDATALTEVRRLVTQENVFAIVPNISANTPGTYLNSEHVPYVGWGIDNTYCSAKPTTKIYGFAFNGCGVPSDPPVAPDSAGALYRYVSEKTGKKHPTIALFSSGLESGKSSVRLQTVSTEGAGFEVVYAQADLPTTTTDYTPFVQKFLTADDGKAPDVISCLVAVQCIAIWDQLKASGYEGTFVHPLFTDLLLKPMAGTVSSASFNPAPNPGLTQMEQDLDDAVPGTKVSSLNAASYFAADMFIQALKKVGKKNITPEKVQQALARQTWQIDGFAGPTRYPAATVITTEYCTALMGDADGTAWNVLEPFSCSAKVYKVKS